MRNGAPLALSFDVVIGDLVVFHIRNVFLPGVRELLQTLSPDDEIVGILVDLSDSGTVPDAFGVVELAHQQRVVVSLRQLRSLPRTPEGNEP